MAVAKRRAPRLPEPLRSGALELPEPGSTFVYRAYCKCGDLLYVGMTNDLFRRFTAHKWARAKWESRVVRIEWDLYSTRGKAEKAEAILIKTLDPLFNKAGRDPRFRKPRWVDLPPIGPVPHWSAWSEDRRIRAYQRVARDERLSA